MWFILPHDLYHLSWGPLLEQELCGLLASKAEKLNKLPFFIIPMLFVITVESCLIHPLNKLLVLNSLSHDQFLGESKFKQSVVHIPWFLWDLLAASTNMAASVGHCHHYHALDESSLSPSALKDFCWPLSRSTVKPLPLHCTVCLVWDNCPFVT
jgi:hypothetical protein